MEKSGNMTKGSLGINCLLLLLGKKLGDLGTGQ